MLIAENLTYNIVEMAMTKFKRNLVTVLLFLLFMTLSSVSVLVFNSKLGALIAMPIILFISYLVSRKAMRLKKIGTIKLTSAEINLENEILGINRNILVGELTKVFIRGGARVDIRGSLHKKTLFLDISLSSGEVVIVHIEVKEWDEDTADQITAYCQALNVPCYRKL